MTPITVSSASEIAPPLHLRGCKVQIVFFGSSGISEMRHPSVQGWRRNARRRGTLLGKRQLNGRLIRHGNGNYGHCCWFRRLNRFSKKTRSKRAFFSKRDCHRGTGARWLACGNLEQAAEGRVIGVVVPLGSFRRRPVSVVRSLSVSSGCARLGHPRTAVSAAFLACRVSRNSLKNLF